jgi:hypothetical protein
MSAHAGTDAWLNTLSGDQLITHSAEHGIPPDPQLRDAGIRAVIRGHHATRARRHRVNGVNDLPGQSTDPGGEPGGS